LREDWYPPCHGEDTIQPPVAIVGRRRARSHCHSLWREVKCLQDTNATSHTDQGINPTEEAHSISNRNKMNHE
jgi:hypothetical protein